MISYKNDKKLPADQLYDLYESINWTKGIDPEQKDEHSKLIRNIYLNSDKVHSAWDDDKLIGTARVISDKYAHGLIYGLAIDPKYDTQTIAQELIRKCMDEYPEIQWTVIAEKWEVSIFKNLGYKESKNSCLNKGDCPI